MNVLEYSTLPIWTRRLIRVVRICGYLIAVAMCFYAAVTCYALMMNDGQPRTFIIVALGLVRAIETFAYGLVALGLAQLLAFLVDDKKSLGFLLRHSDKVLYLWATTNLLYIVLTISFQWIREDRIGLSSFVYFTMISLGVASWLTRVLLLVLIGLVLRCVLPIIEESRSVV